MAAIGQLAIRAAAASSAAAHRGNADSATIIVRIGRGMYVLSASSLALFWYFGWRNQRVHSGTGKFPIPGLNKDPVTQPGGAEDVGIAPNVSLPDITGVAPGTGIAPVNPNIVPATGSGGYAGRLIPPNSPSGNRAFLDWLGHIAQSSFGLHVGENPDFGGVHPVHTAGSFHYKGRAIDCSAPLTADGKRKMAQFANWVATNYGPHITELFWRGQNWVIIKNGARQTNFNFVSGHQDHVHIAV